MVTPNHNLKNTPGNVIFGNVLSMDTNQWEHLREGWQRLKWARIRWQDSIGVSDNAVAAAESLGMKPVTYRCYERGPGEGSKSIPVNFDIAKRAGTKYKVSWVWLLSGEGTPFEMQPAGPTLRINNAINRLDVARQEQLADFIENFLNTGTN